MREATGGRLHCSHRGSLGLPHLHRAQLPRHLGQVAQEVPDRAVSSALVSRWLIAAFVDIHLRHLAARAQRTNHSSVVAYSLICSFLSN